MSAGAQKECDLGGCTALHRTMVGLLAVSVKPGSDVVQPPKMIQR